MAKRDGVIVRVDVPCDGGVSPNRQIPQVTVEIRLHWPRRATQTNIDMAMLQAVGKLMLAYQERSAEAPAPQNVWLQPPPGWSPP